MPGNDKFNNENGNFNINFKFCHELSNYLIDELSHFLIDKFRTENLLVMSSPDRADILPKSRRAREIKAIAGPNAY